MKNHPDTDLAKAAQKGLDGTPTDVSELEGEGETEEGDGTETPEGGDQETDTASGEGA